MQVQVYGHLAAAIRPLVSIQGQVGESVGQKVLSRRSVSINFWALPKIEGYRCRVTHEVQIDKTYQTYLQG